jgi:hypothetical protein
MPAYTTQRERSGDRIVIDLLFHSRLTISQFAVHRIEDVAKRPSVRQVNKLY